MKALCVGVGVLTMAACGGSGATVNGTLLGKTVVAKDAMSYVSNGETQVVIADFAGVCGEVSKNEIKANSNVISFGLGGTPLAQGAVYSFGGITGFLDSAQFAEFDSKCGTPAGESATAGTVTLTSASASEVDGQFDLTFGSDHVTGQFNAPNCAGAVNPPTGTSTCN